ncbi:MAG: hypothetical protein IJP92_05120 [Lachnospiraceae bacterium]|nr:hypothetical protein [Lachnospiraceae bacterium]
MKTPDHNNIDMLRLRREHLPEQLRRIDNIASGRNTLFLPLITGEDGHVADRKRTKLVKEMLDALTVYLNSTHDPARGKKQMQLYRYFLYNAMMCLKCMPDGGYGGMYSHACWEFSAHFSDLIDLAEHIDAGETLHDLEETELMDYRYGHPGIAPGFFCSMNDTYELLFGRHIAMLLPKARRKQHVNAGNEEMEEEAEEQWNALEEEARLAGFDSVRDYGAYLADRNDDDMTEEELLAQEEWDDFLKERQREGENAKKAFLKRVGDKKKWLQQYQRFRELYFSEDTDVTLLAGDIRDAVDAWLYLHGLSPFSYGDAYGLITNRLDRMTGQLRAEVKRARRYV